MVNGFLADLREGDIIEVDEATLETHVGGLELSISRHQGGVGVERELFWMALGGSIENEDLAMWLLAHKARTFKVRLSAGDTKLTCNSASYRAPSFTLLRQKSSVFERKQPLQFSKHRRTWSGRLHAQISCLRYGMLPVSTSSQKLDLSPTRMDPSLPSLVDLSLLLSFCSTIKVRFLHSLLSIRFRLTKRSEAVIQFFIGTC